MWSAITLSELLCKILAVCFARRRLDQILEQVDLVVRMHALQHRGDALEPHAGVDRGLGQRMQLAVIVAVELHEHQVPDLDVAIAIGFRRAGRAARDVRTVIVEDLGARPARPGLAHLPEIVALVFGAARLVADARDALARHPDLVRPDVVGLVIGLIHRHPQPVLRQPVDGGQQLPREMDRFALEVIAEAEIAEHLEKRVVARGIADVLEIVVLAAGAHAALRGGGAHVGALLLAEEHVLELHHAGIGEQQCRIIARHERARGHDGVALALEVIEETACGFRCFSWLGPVR